MRLRFELARNGGSLRVESWRGIRLDERPKIRTSRRGGGDGVTTLRLGRGAQFGYGVVVELWARGDNLIEVGERSRVLDGARLELRSGEIRVGAGSLIRDRVVLKSNGVLQLGTRVVLSYGVTLHCTERIEIGDYAALGEYGSVTDSDHTPDGTDEWVLHRPLLVDPTSIGANVIAGGRFVILRGVQIGPNAAIAANSVLRKGGYEGGWLYAGSPARPVRRLDEGRKPTLG
jgi:acetyltransferase-like isoleucine patch superfamily enzyme